MKKKEKGLTAWQLTMMALGSVVGASFFLGSAVAIKAAGPAISITYILAGILVYFILYALSEMTVANPNSGSFYTFTAEVYGPGAGFVVGWVYWAGMVLAMSSEATAVAILLQEWFPRLSLPIVGSVIIILTTLVNLLGADKLSKLESSLSIVKVLAVIAFIVIGILLITGAIGDNDAIGVGELASEEFMPGGITSMAGSLLIIVFSYAGFEIIGLAASEADNPHKTIPRAILYTVVSLVGLYLLSIFVLLPLIPTSSLSENVSPMVAALSRWGMGWAGEIINFILVSAILSTMLAATFGIGRMMRSIAADGHAPRWLVDRKDIPYRGILFSGAITLVGLWFGLLFPSVYLFLISSSGYATLFTYLAIVATHIRFRRCNGCPPEGKCQMPGYPYTSWIALISLVIAIVSMPFIPGQAPGLIAGVIMTAIFAGVYFIMNYIQTSRDRPNIKFNHKEYQARFSEEISRELYQKDKTMPLKKTDKTKNRTDMECRNRKEK